ncbi:MAG: hypothetical protein GX061_02485 [Eubacteriaceae bacterium]|nr:hypothetical protein [Eubacteriaceae bacterium]
MWNKEDAPLIKPLIIIFLISFAVFWAYPAVRMKIGLPYDKLKDDVYKDAAKSIDISAYELVTAKTDKMAVFILYNTETKDNKFSVYIKKGRGHIGYFFIKGGGLAAQQDGVMRTTVNYNDINYTVVFSPKNEGDTALSEYSIEIISDKPFIVILPEGTKVGETK